MPGKPVARSPSRSAVFTPRSIHAHRSQATAHSARSNSLLRTVRRDRSAGHQVKTTSPCVPRDQLLSLAQRVRWCKASVLDGGQFQSGRDGRTTMGEVVCNKDDQGGGELLGSSACPMIGGLLYGGRCERTVTTLSPLHRSCRAAQMAARRAALRRATVQECVSWLPYFRPRVVCS